MKTSITSGKIYDKAYSLSNYEIEYTDNNNNDERLCAIYFSSSGIYYPNTEEQLETRILKENIYEWRNHRINRASKHIFVRDIAKSFYVTGISKMMPTIDDVISFLRTETEGFEVITVGSSSGGYMAVLAGEILGARLCFTFSCFWSLFHIDYNTWPLVGENPFKGYYDLISLVKNNENGNTKIIYIYPAKNNDRINNDQQQSSLVKESGIDRIIAIPIDSEVHGVCLNDYMVSRIINLDSSKLELLGHMEIVSEKELARRILSNSDILYMNIYVKWKRIKKRIYLAVKYIRQRNANG